MRGLLLLIVGLAVGFLSNDFLSGRELTAFLPVTNLVLSAVIAGATWLLYVEAERSRRAQSMPAISVFIRPLRDNNLIQMLEIKNFGSGPAYDINFELGSVDVSP